MNPFDCAQGHAERTEVPRLRSGYVRGIVSKVELGAEA